MPFAHIPHPHPLITFAFTPRTNKLNTFIRKQHRHKHYFHQPALILPFAHFHTTMSSQVLQQPATTTTQQPFTVYPYNVPGQPPPPLSLTSQPSHSGGSFGSVFVVLAVIVVVSAIACCLGQFCTRRHEKPPKARKKAVAAAQPPKEVDIEFGFDHKKIRTANKPVRYGEYKGNKPTLDGGHGFKKQMKMPPFEYDG